MPLDLIKEDKEALSWLSQNREDPRAPQVAQKLGIDPQDVDAWSWSDANQQDERASKIKNKIFDKIAGSRQAVDTQGVSSIDRFMVKNLVDNEPKVQETYFKKKGFDTRIIDNQVEVKRPGDPYFQKIDPSGIDVWDVTDLAGDVIEGVAGAVTSGAKFLGAVGAPATGGASLAAASAIGAGVSGGLETTRQVAGKALGLRDEINTSKILQSTAIGAAMPGIGAALSGISKGAGKILSKIRGLDDIKLKPDAEQIKIAAQKIGAEVTPGQLYEHKYVQQLEESLRQSEGTFGGWKLRRAMRGNVKAAQEAAEAIIGTSTERTAFESGDLAKEQIRQEFAEIIKPAEAIYDKYESLFKNSDIKPNILKAKTAIKKAMAESLDPQVTQVLKKLEGSLLPQVENLSKLKETRTLVGKNISESTNPAVKHALGQVYGALTEIRSDTLKSAGKKFGADDIAKAVADDIDTADFLYRGAAEQLQSTVFANGKKIRGGLKGALDNYLNKSPEIDLINKILKTNDPKKIAYVKEVFPKTFETLRSAKVSEIVKNAETKGSLSPRRLVNAIDSMPPETSRMIFGDHGVEKAQALKKFLDSIPGKEVLGPSGTPEGWFFQLAGQIRQIRSARNSFNLSSAQRVAMERDLFTIASKSLGSTSARGFGIIGARQLLNDGEDGSQYGLRLPTEAQPGLRLPK